MSQQEGIEVLATQQNSRSSLPPEVLTLIFKYAITFTYLLDYSPLASPSGGYYNDLRFKKGLLHVCRVWHEAAIRVLYEDVVFRRCTQIPMFLDTLGKSPYLEGVVKSIMILCNPLPDCEERFTGDIQKLYECCPKATHIEYHPPFCTTGGFEESTATTKEFIPPISHHITHLTFGKCVSYAVLENCLKQVQGTLRSLSFTLGIISPATQTLSFPHLNMLQVVFHGDRRDTWDHLSKWETPSLTHFTFHALKARIPEAALVTLLKSSAQSLRFFHIQTSSNVQPFLDVCPELEHLVVTSNQNVDEFVHPKIRWLDVWPTKSNVDTRTLCKLLDEDIDHLPRLRGIRNFHVSLHTFLQLPLIFPPDLHVKRDFGDEVELPLDICACWIKRKRFEWTFLHPLRSFVEDHTLSRDEFLERWLAPVDGDDEREDSNSVRRGSEKENLKGEALEEVEDMEDPDWVPFEDDSESDLTSEDSDLDAEDDGDHIPIEETQSLGWVPGVFGFQGGETVMRTYRHKLQ
ncbi:hypothetical protein BDN72DRAFT_838676 [Pluteus cervinus]|uniref:Uncharacterized protein n=1 Tax=Pluteus cervinus TaxID=181527 RepID=A0ACD3AZ59_9AGAR|nr:hypothetical protein BDN72DRAFT_838676 [Pluteus cervinus]